MARSRRLEGFDGLGGNASCVRRPRSAPGLPVEAEELVEQAGAFKSERNGGKLAGKLGQGEHLSLDYPIIVASGCGVEAARPYILEPHE